MLTLILGFYRGIAPGVTGSLATGATYFGFIESTKKWIEASHPSLGGHWVHFIAGAIGMLSNLPLLSSLGHLINVVVVEIRRQMYVHLSGN